MTDPRSDDDLTAAEFALGLLDPAERQAAAAREMRDPAFAAAVARWEEQAASLFDLEALPPANIWPAIAARLPANDDRRALGRWRWATGGAVAAALVLGVVALRPGAAPHAMPAPVLAPAHPLVALLAAPGRREALAVSIAADRRGFATSAVALDLGAHSAELWVIPAGGAPRSLGVVVARPGWRAVAPALAASLTPGATLAVSVEPRGGSPTGKPTGPVIVSGIVSAT